MRLFVYLALIVAGQTTDLKSEPEAKAEPVKSEIIHVDGQINDDMVVPFVTALDEQIKTGSVVIEINSPGGAVDAGFMMVKAIEAAPVPVVCIVDGEAASMAMYLLQACDVRVMTTRSILMIHSVAMYGRMGGGEDDWRGIADRMAAMNKAMFKHIARRSKVTPEYLELRCAGSKQWWLDSDEATEYKFVDLVVNKVEDVL